MYINDQEQGGSVLNNFSQDLDENNKSIEILTSFVHTPQNNNIIQKNSMITLKNLNQMSLLDNELSRLNGKISTISTKYNDEGQKVKIIKIKKKKRIEDEKEDDEKLQKVLEKVRRKVSKNIKKNIDEQKSKIERIN